MEDEKKLKVQELALMYYSRKDVQNAIYEFCKSREVTPRYVDGFGKRPDVLEFPGDILQQARKGATSFHCSEEIWKNPFELSTDFSREQLDNMREGWDLLIDIDSKYLEYSKIMAKLVVQAFEFHGVKNIGIKYSGSKGFHIIVPWKAFPEEINSVQTCKMFPEWPRAVASYLSEFIKKQLINKISELTTDKSYIKDKEGAEKVVPDIILVSSRHLFRAPYSLHEKTALASCVIDKNEISSFEPKHADTLKVKIKNYYPEAKKNEARELLMQSLDWQESREKKAKNKPKSDKKYEKIEIDKSTLVYPPCIQKILEGLEDGKKRALFILINYYRSLNFSDEEVTNKINEWNSKNKKQLKQDYIDMQLKWTFARPAQLPPNCDKMYYKDIKICNPDNFCSKIKNPVNYTILKSRKREPWKNKS